MLMAHFLFCSVNLRRPLQRLSELIEAEVLGSGDLEDRGLTAATELGRIRQFGGDIDRDHDRPMLVGVDEIVGAYRHPGDTNLAAKALGMNPGVRRADRAGQCLETRRPLRDVADRAVGNHPEAAERLVHVALNLAPERAIAAVSTVDVMD